MSYSPAVQKQLSEFTDYTEAIAFLRRHGGKYSVRPIADSVGVPEFTSQRSDAADLMAVLSLARASAPSEAKHPRFVLIEAGEFIQ